MAPPRFLRLSQNTLWNIFGQGGLLVLSFFLLPILIRILDSEQYALYSLMGVLVGYLTLLSFGAGNASMKFTSESLARGDPALVKHVAKFSALAHTVGVGIGAVIVFFLRGWLAKNFFNISPHLLDTAQWIIGCGAFAAVFYSLVQCAVSLFQGMQKFPQSNLLSMLQNGCVIAGSVLLLTLGFSLKAVGTYYVALHCLLALGGLAGAVSHLPKPTGETENPDPELAGKFSKYGFQVFLSQLAWSVAFQWDKAFIGYFFPMATLTYLLVPKFILQKFWIIPASISMAAFPMMTELKELGEEKKLRSVYQHCGQLILWFIVPVFAVLFVLAPQIFTLWLTSEFSEKCVWPFRFLLGGYFFHLIGAMPITASLSLGKPGYALAWNASQALLCMIFWPFLIPRYGINGAAFGFLLAQVLTSLPFSRFVSRKLFDMRFWDFLDGVMLRPMAAGGIFVIYLWPLRPYAWNWATLIALTGVSVLLYYTIGLWALGAEERATLNRIVDATKTKFAKKN